MFVSLFSNNPIPPDKPPGESGLEKILTAAAVLLVTCVIPAAELAIYLFAPPEMVLAGCTIAFLAILGRLVLRPHANAEKLAVALMLIALAVAGVWSGHQMLSEEHAAPVSNVRVLPDVALDGKATAITEARDGNVWVGGENGGVQAIDPISRQPVGAALDVGRRVRDLQALGRFLFAAVGRGMLIRIDPSPSPLPTAHLRFGKGDGKLARGMGSIWIADQEQPRIIRVSPMPLRRIATIPLSPRHAARATALTFGDDGYLWVVDAGLSRLYKVDPKTDEVVFSRPILRSPEEILVRHEIIYVAHPRIRKLERFDAVSATQLRGSTPIDPGPIKLAAGCGFLFVLSSFTGTIKVHSLPTGKPIGPLPRVADSPIGISFNAARAEGFVISGSSTSLTPIALTDRRDARR